MLRPRIGLPTAAASGSKAGSASGFFPAFSGFSVFSAGLRTRGFFSAGAAAGSPAPPSFPAWAAARCSISSRVTVQTISRRSSCIFRRRSSRSPATVSSTRTRASKISRIATASRGPMFFSDITRRQNSSGSTSVSSASFSPEAASSSLRSWFSSICQPICPIHPVAEG